VVVATPARMINARTLTSAYSSCKYGSVVAGRPNDEIAVKRSPVVS